MSRRIPAAGSTSCSPGADLNGDGRDEHPRGRGYEEHNVGTTRNKQLTKTKTELRVFVNEGTAVSGTRRSCVTKGAMPAVSPAEARRLLEAITTTLAGLRDRALLSVTLYTASRG